MHELMVGSGKSMPAEIMLIQAISYVDGRAIKLTVGYYQTMPSWTTWLAAVWMTKHNYSKDSL